MTPHSFTSTLKKATPFILLLFFTQIIIAQAHTINYQMEQQPTHNVVWYYLQLGFQHILPDGFDHILFIISLCLVAKSAKQILWQCTAFTVAHTITLIMSMKNIIVAPPSIIEPIIALSIAFVAIENIFMKNLNAGRILLIFAFGLVHGCGFASSLNEIGLPRNQFYTSLLSFNIGVEIGQLAVIGILFAAIIIWTRTKPWYSNYVVKPASIAIACISLFWVMERMA